MNIRICPKCKDPRDEESFTTGRWCLECKARYRDSLVSLGKRRDLKRQASLHATPQEAPETPGIERLVALARRSGTLRTQAVFTNNKVKWRQFYTNEKALEKEIKKWQTLISPPLTS